MIYFNLQKSLKRTSDLLNHDAPVLRILTLALGTFLLISSITVFLGVKAHLAEYLTGRSPLLVGISYGLGYLIFSLLPDLLNSIFAAHITRSFLLRKFRDHLSLILIGVLASICLLLTVYSWRMSRGSAESVARHYAPVAEYRDVARLDSLAAQEKANLRQAFEMDRQKIGEKYDRLLLQQLEPLRNSLKSNEQEIAALEANRKTSNTYWTNREIEKIRRKMAPVNSAINRNSLRNEEAKNAEISRLTRRYEEDLRFLNNRLFENRSETRRKNDREENQIEGITAILTKELKKIAGFSILIVLALTVLLEILYHRNGIERQVHPYSLSFRQTWMLEIIYLPFCVLGRYLINAVRKRYQRLPPLLPEPAFKSNTAIYSQKQLVNGRPSPAEFPEKDHLQPVNGENPYESWFTGILPNTGSDCEKKGAVYNPGFNGKKGDDSPSMRNSGKTAKIVAVNTHASRGVPNSTNFPNQRGMEKSLFRRIIGWYVPTRIVKIPFTKRISITASAAKPIGWIYGKKRMGP